MGETLTADTTAITDPDGLDHVSYSYQWLADDTDITDATSSTYTPVAADLTKTIKVRVSFSDDTGNTETLTSAAVEPVDRLANSPATGAPAITGTARVGETLTADTAGIADANGLDHVSFSYQWLADDTDITDATSSTYTPVAADLAKSIMVRVSFSDDAGYAETLTSAAVGPVDHQTSQQQQPQTSQQRNNGWAFGVPVIVGAARVGETLTADISGIADPDGLDNVSFSYQWLADDTGIDGATSSTYTPVAADLTKTIKVRVSFSDDAGNAETLTSAATAALSLPLLTATVHDAPAGHDGSNVFTFELRFSEELRPDFGYATLRDDAFTITGGTVTNAGRIERPENGVNKNIRWRITIDPDTSGDVTITLPSTEDCEADGALCTEDGRMFSGPLQLTVPRTQG